jgi:hypothetical protein
VSTALHETLGVAPHIVEAILNHRIGGIAGIYNRSTYVEEKRRALTRWADHLMAVIEGRTLDNVVKLAR